MARARNIKPGFFKNEELVELPFETRLLFIGLWTLADREGRLEDRPKRIQMEIFPADPVNINECLNQLQGRGFILRYEVDGARYIQVIAFNKHQRPHSKEQDSTIPEPPSDKPRRQQTTTKVGASNDLGNGEHALIPDTGYLNADTPSSAPKPARKSGALNKTQQARFERWYEEYPKKLARGTAEKAWAKIDPDDDLTERMIAKVREWAKSHDWTKDGGQFVPYPATWLNNSRWLDGPPSQGPGTISLLPNGQPSPFAGRGYDPYRSISPEERADYEKQLAAAKAEAEAYERRGA